MTPSDSPVAPVFAKSGLWRNVAAIVLTLILTVFLVLVAVGALLAFAKHPGLALCQLVAVGLILLMLVFAAWKRIPFFDTWVKVATVSLVTLAILVWLRWDDARLDHSLTMEALSPSSGAQAEESYAVTLWYSEQNGQSAPRKFTDQGFVLRTTPTGNLSEWETEILQKRANIETAWTDLAAEREWFAALDAFDAIGDARSVDFETPIIKFAPVRRLTGMITAKAGLLALDGRGDEAVEMLLPLLSVSLKLERNSRTMVRTMVANTGLQQGLATGRFILDRAAVSPGKKAELMAAIESRDTQSIVRQLVWTDYVIQHASLNLQPHLINAVLADELGLPTMLVRGLLPWLFLPNRTGNLVAGMLAELETAGQQRDWDRIESLEQSWLAAIHPASPKNLGGQILLNYTTVSMGKLLRRVWEVEDVRISLLEEINRIDHP